VISGGSLNTEVDVDALEGKMRRKREFKEGITKFNSNPKSGLQFLIQKKFIEDSPQGIARFLFTNQDISKSKLGEYFGKDDKEVMKVLTCYLEFIPMAGLELDAALRAFLAGTCLYSFC
jgi:Sec7-like guanine-nucleotide exchange factor